MKSVSDLVFRALDEITDNEDELWVAQAIFDEEASRTGDIQRIMKKDSCLSYHAVQRALKTLVDKGIIIRVLRGKYAPNLKMILGKMVIELQEDEG